MSTVCRRVSSELFSTTADGKVDLHFRYLVGDDSWCSGSFAFVAFVRSQGTRGTQERSVHVDQSEERDILRHSTPIPTFRNGEGASGMRLTVARSLVSLYSESARLVGSLPSP